MNTSSQAAAFWPRFLLRDAGNGMLPDEGFVHLRHRIVLLLGSGDGACPVTEIAYRSWDTMLVLWEASKIAGSNDTEALKAAIDQVKDLEGLGGILDYTTGDHEGYHSFNSFVLLGSHFQLYSDWAANGGYDAYKAATGNEK